MSQLETRARIFLAISFFALSIFPGAAAQLNLSGRVPSNALPTPSGKTEAQAPYADDSSLKLAPGDTIEVSVYNVPELSSKGKIANNGEIYLPLVDYVHVSGLTPEGAQELIQHRLSDGGFVKNPHVNVTISERGSHGTSVLGEVTKPGVYPMAGEERLFDLISAAGGFTEKAGQSISITHHSDPAKPIVVPLSRNLSDSPESNIPVFPGDTVIVRKADVVYVVGEVGHPSGFLMDSGRLTVLQAIALAGGTTKNAKLSAARIIRHAPTGMTETHIQLKKMLEAKAPDETMQAEDILFIPSSAAKVAMGRTLEAALQAATAVSIVAIHP